MTFVLWHFGICRTKYHCICSLENNVDVCLAPFMLCNLRRKCQTKYWLPCFNCFRLVKTYKSRNLLTCWLHKETIYAVKLFKKYCGFLSIRRKPEHILWNKFGFPSNFAFLDEVLPTFLEILLIKCLFFAWVMRNKVSKLWKTSKKWNCFISRTK